MAAKGTTTSSSLKEYLKKYVSNDEEDKKKKMKKKKKKTKQEASKVLLVDEDPVWQKPVNPDEEEDGDDSTEEKPQVDEDIEVRRMKRLEYLRSRRPYHALSEDGSGWVSVSDTPVNPDSNVQNNDMSPPRKGRARFDTPSPEPELASSRRQRRTQDHGSSLGHDREQSVSPRVDQDISPPRRRRPRVLLDENQNEIERPDVGDISPPRRVRQSSHVPNLSPPRKKRHYSPSPEPEALTTDMSPPRRSRPVAKDDTKWRSQQHSLPTDLSPPRKSRRVSERITSPQSSPRRDDARSLKEQPKTGLVTGKDIKDEISKIKKNALLRFQEMDPSTSGQGAVAVYRDKTGKRISKEEYLKSKKPEEKPKEKKLEWGKGLAQKREAEQRLQELELEKEKPFARTRDDKDLDTFLKDKVRWGDPMAHLVKKKNLELSLPDLGENDKMKESGFIVPQEIPKHSWLRRGLDAAPNRYGIRPGRHWDGVDRSTGYEKDLFKTMNEKRATAAEAYLWSVSDM
ncbi:unnamed protein product [Rhodiola kirilowii]